MKRGSLSLQFNWIFVILVGMALLGILFMQSQQSATKARYEADLKLRESLQGMLASTSQNNYKEINLGAVAVLNDCDETSSNLYIGKGRVPIETTYFALHAPKRINSRTLHLQTVEGITFMTGNDHKYLFINDYDEIIDIYNLFEGNKQLVERSEIRSFPPDDSSLKYTMIFYFPNFNPQTDRIEYNNVNQPFNIVIISPSLNDGRSVVYFRTNQILGESDPVEYLNNGELLGAIVDANYELFSCLHKKQLEKELLRLNLLASKKDRMESIVLEENPSCANLLNIADQYFNSANSSLKDLNNPEVSDYKDAMIGLEQLNVDLARNNCPLIQ